MPERSLGRHVLMEATCAARHPIATHGPISPIIFVFMQRRFRARALVSLSGKRLQRNQKRQHYGTEIDDSGDTRRAAAGGYSPGCRSSGADAEQGREGRDGLQPDFITAAQGDTVTFVPTDKSHDAESIKDMIPEGAIPFKGKMNEQITVTLTQEGVYGVKCTPHYGMGMVALIVVGKPLNLDQAKAVKQTGKAKEVFAELFEQVPTN